MKINELSVEINRPIGDVFLYTINPKNTPKWISSIVEEQAPTTINKGTKYRNKDSGGRWSEYTVTELVPQQLFELTSENGLYHVRYTYQALEPSRTLLTYTEWIDIGGLPAPFSQETLDKLKIEMEKENNG